MPMPAIHAIPSPYHSKLNRCKELRENNEYVLYNQSPSIALNLLIFSIPIAISTPLVI
jgi:hypothetical protein